MYHKHVSANVGRNPIARAVAQQALRKAALDQKIKLHLTDDGAPCVDFCAVIGMTLSVVVYAAQLDKTISPNDLRVRITRGGLSACSQMADANAFNRANIPAIERAMDAAIELNMKLNPDSVNKAWAALVKQGFTL